MKYTSNHNFKLPAPSDTIDVEVLNENFVNIDAPVSYTHLDVYKRQAGKCL